MQGKRVRLIPLSATSPRMIATPIGLSVASGPGLCLAGLLGLVYGQRLSANQYRNESGRAACRRLLFQAELAAAADRGDDGDLEGVRELVRGWFEATARGARMQPLCYRLRGSSPLAVAVAYVNNHDNAILKQLLRLPHLFYTQSAERQWHSEIEKKTDCTLCPLKCGSLSVRLTVTCACSRISLLSSSRRVPQQPRRRRKRNHSVAVGVEWHAAGSSSVRRKCRRPAAVARGRSVTTGSTALARLSCLWSAGLAVS